MAREVFLDESNRKKQAAAGLGAFAALAVFTLGLLFTFYSQFVINVPAKNIAILIHKRGIDLANSDEIAPDKEHKGVQKEVLDVGRYFFKYDPYNWEWKVVPQVEIPDGKLGIKIRMYGDDLPYGEFLAFNENQKGIVPGVILPGRYAINPFLYDVEQHEPQIVPAGFKGVVTNLAGKIPSALEDYADETDPMHQKLLVKKGFRGVEQATLDPGTYTFNPYEIRVDLVDCRNQRFNLSETRDLGFPSKDGFWVSLDSIVEFRVNPVLAAKVYVLYKEHEDDEGINPEIVRKIILPAARSFCRLQGSNNSGRDFIQGTTRTQFQENYQAQMRRDCEDLGIDIIQALITKINPPEQIAKPVRNREIAKQQEEQYRQQILQQKSEEKLAIEKEMVKQKPAVIQAEQAVIQVTTVAMREQEVAKTKAQQELAVAQLKLEATKDEAAAITARGKGAAEVVAFKNQAEAAGWKRSVEAFDGDGGQLAQYVMFQKMSAAYRSIMVNTADSPIMKIFESFNRPPRPSPGNLSEVKTAGDAQ
ncbi:MAG: band 7 protein [Planctomycetaceae bacterium]|nr:band 7 protein [Planctomycetaceae bacterium]